MSPMLTVAVDFAGAALLTGLLLWGLLATGLGHLLALDRPNHRSLHEHPTPRVGGLALVPVCLAWIAWSGVFPAGAMIATAVLAAVSFADDRYGLPIAIRFVVQLACAVGVLFAPLHQSPVTLALAVFGCVWMMNLFNFMDGSDGLAGGMALFGFGAFGLAAWRAGDASLAGACSAVAGGAAGFLAFNFHPAKVFLGDAGSIPLGFLASTVAWRGIETLAWPLWFPLLVFSPFIADASLTLLARASRDLRVWRAHREHVYQRMVAGGLGHRRTALAWYGLMAAACVSALFLLGQAPAIRRVALAAWVIAYPVAFIVARRVWRM